MKWVDIIKNSVVYKFKNKVKISIKGKHIDRFVRKLINNKLELLSISYPAKNEAKILIYKNDYDKFLKIKGIYDVNVEDVYGLLKVKKIVSVNKYVILALILGFFMLTFLSNVIFSIDIVHNNKEIRNLINEELENYGMKRLSIKKDFESIEKIKKEIIEKHKDKIEWLEIETIGTKYVVRIEMRKIIDNKNDDQKQNVVSAKSAIIKKVTATSGEIVRNVNDYVEPGDVIISGTIKLNDEIKNITSAKGEVFGEVWYEVSVTFPYFYQEVKETGEKNNVLVLKFLSKSIEILNFNKFKDKKIEEKILLKNFLIPFGITFQKQKELEVRDEIYTEEEALEQALILARKKIEDKLDENEYIIDQKKLKINIKDSKIELDMFFSVYENITSYQAIEEIIEEEP